MTSKVRQTQIRDIPFFENYITYINLKYMAKDRSMTYGGYMAEILLSYCADKDYTHPPAINTAKLYHEVVKMVAHLEGTTIPQVIEKVAAEAIRKEYKVAAPMQPVAEIVPSKTKSSFFDLNRGVK